MKKNEVPARQIEQMLKARYRVPDVLLRQYRVACADKAVQDATDIKMNRVYSVTALALARFTKAKGDKWGEKRITEFLYSFSDCYEDFIKSGDRWPDLMKALSDEAGIIIRTGEEGDELIEYDDKEES